jgi:hypothetical protein
MLISVIVLSVACYLYSECHNAKCRYAEYLCAEWHGALSKMKMPLKNSNLALKTQAETALSAKKEQVESFL